MGNFSHQILVHELIGGSLESSMQKLFATQPELFVSSVDLDRLVLHALNDAEHH